MGGSCGNQGDPQQAFLILAGGQYEATFHRERFYAQAIVGEGGLNGTWFSTANSGYKNGNTGTIASLAEFPRRRRRHPHRSSHGGPR